MGKYITNLIKKLEDTSKLYAFNMHDIYLPDDIIKYKDESLNFLENHISRLIINYNIHDDLIQPLLYLSLKDNPNYNNLKYRIITKFNIISDDESIIETRIEREKTKHNKKKEKLKSFKQKLDSITIHPKNKKATPTINLNNLYYITFFSNPLTKDSLKPFFDIIKLSDSIVFIQLKYDNHLFTKCENYKPNFNKDINNEEIHIVYNNNNIYVDISIIFDNASKNYLLSFNYTDSDSIIAELTTTNIKFDINDKIHINTISGNIELFLPNFSEVKLYRSTLFDTVINKYIYIDEKDTSRSLNNSTKYYFNYSGDGPQISTSDGIIQFEINKIISSYYSVEFKEIKYDNVSIFCDILIHLLTKSTLKTNFDLEYNDYDYSSILNNITNSIENNFLSYSDVISESDETITINYNKNNEKTQGLFQYDKIKNGSIIESKFIQTNIKYTSQKTFISLTDIKQIKLNKIDYDDDEELQSDDEELQSDDEELQSDDEELQTDDEELQSDDEELQTDDDETVSIKYLDYNYDGSFFYNKKLNILKEKNINFKNLSYASSCMPEKQPVVVEEEDIGNWERGGYNILKINNINYLCADQNFKYIYKLAMNLPCCKKKASKVTLKDNIIFSIVDKKYDKLKEPKTFIGSLLELLNSKLKTKFSSELEVRNYIIEEGFNLEIVYQECYNIKNIKEKIQDLDFAFDSMYFYKLMEHILQINIFVLNDASFEIPNNANYHCREINERYQTLFIYKEDNVYYRMDNIFDMSISKKLKELYMNHGYTLYKDDKKYNNPTMHYNWNFILNDHELVSQKINANGRMYGVDIKFISSADEEHIITLFVQETYPLYVKSDNRIYETNEQTCIELFGIPNKKTKSGLFYNLGDLENELFVPCETDSSDNYECINYELLKESNIDYNLNYYAEFSNYSLFIIKVLLYLKNIEPDISLHEWKKKYITIEDVTLVPFKYNIINMLKGCSTTSECLKRIESYVKKNIKKQNLPKELEILFRDQKIHITKDIYKKFELNIEKQQLKNDKIIVKNYEYYSDFNNLYFKEERYNYSDTIIYEKPQDLDKYLLKINEQLFICENHNSTYKNECIDYLMNYSDLNECIHYYKGEEFGINSTFTRLNLKKMYLYYIELNDEQDCNYFQENDIIYTRDSSDTEIELGRIKKIKNKLLYTVNTLTIFKYGCIYYKNTDRQQIIPSNIKRDKLLNIVLIEYDKNLKIINLVSNFETKDSNTTITNNQNNTYLHILSNKTYFSMIPTIIK